MQRKCEYNFFLLIDRLKVMSLGNAQIFNAGNTKNKSLNISNKLLIAVHIRDHAYSANIIAFNLISNCLKQLTILINN